VAALAAVDCRPLDARRNRHEPYIFTGQEITALLMAAGQHRWHLPAVTYPALFGLIAATEKACGSARQPAWTTPTPTPTWTTR
jgi:hypothetical protein